VPSAAGPPLAEESSRIEPIEELYSYVDWLDPRQDTMERRYKSLRDDVAKNSRAGNVSAKRRICLVAWEYEELVVHGGGIGTAFTALARALAHAGHNVTVLVNRADPVDYAAMLVAGWNEWRTLIFDRDNITLHEPMGGIEGLGKTLDRCGFACVWSYVAFRWLADRDGQFDIVHFHDNAAFGYFSILARQQMRYLANTLIVVGAHGPHFWERKANRLYLTATYNLEADYMERYMARWCDYLVAPSSFIADWMWRNEWRLSPSRVRVWQNVMPVSKLVLERRLARAQAVLNGTAFFDGPDLPRDAAMAGEDSALPAGCATPDECAQARALPPNGVHRIVFFGRHETRKGLRVFLDAAALINETLIAHNIDLIFLGSQSLVDGELSEVFITERCNAANLACTQRTELGRVAAAELLAQPYTLTVVASLTENSPYTVLECLGAPLPFIASRVGGIPELIAEEDRERVLFDPTPQSLAARLSHVYYYGLVPARYAITPAETERIWVEWHSTVPLRPPLANDPVTHAAPVPSPLPGVALCVAHRNSAALLNRTLAAARDAAAQYEGAALVVLVDAHSDERGAATLVDEFEAEARAQPATRRLLRRDATTPVGEARNACARSATASKYLVFVDQGDVILPGALATLVTLAEKRNLSVTGAPARVIREQNATDEIELFTGCGESGDGYALYHNCYGSTSALVRRDAFLAAGGFRRDEYGVDDGTHALYAAIVLGGGRLEQAVTRTQFERYTAGAELVLPRFGDVADEFVQRSRQLRPYVAALHPSMRAVGMFSLDMYQTFRDIETKKKRWYSERLARVQNALTLLKDFYYAHKTNDTE
jgi:glycosyltransferase involved in cell wall biosynthesis